MNPAPNETNADAETETSLLDIALMLKEQWKVIILTPLLTGLAALGLAFSMKPVFTSTTLLLVPQQSQGAVQMLLGGSLGGLGSLGGALLGGKNPSDQWIAMLKSNSIADALVAQFKLEDYYHTGYQFQAVQRLSAVTRIQTTKEGLISVDVTDLDPKMAANLASAYVQQLQVMSKRLAITDASQRRAFFETQLKDTSAQLVSAEIALSGTGITPSLLRSSPEASVTEIGRIKSQISAQEVKVAVMRGALTDASPEMRVALKELESLKKQLADAATRDTTVGSNSSTEYVGRYRDFKYAETMYELLSKQLELAKLDESNNGALIQVVDAAQVPQWKSGPKRGLIALVGFVFGLVVAITFVAVRKSIKDNRNPETAEKWSQLLGRRRSATAN